VSIFNRLRRSCVGSKFIHTAFKGGLFRKDVHIINVIGARIAQSGWTTEGAEFEAREGQELSPRRPDRLSGTHPASYSLGTGVSVPEDKAAGA
jgi:hypothetical protein